MAVHRVWHTSCTLWLHQHQNRAPDLRTHRFGDIAAHQPEDTE